MNGSKYLSSRMLLLGLVLVAIAASLAAQAPQPLKGQWLISPSDKPGQVQFTFSYSRNRAGHSFSSTNSDNMPISDLAGLTPEALQADGAHTQFKVARASGTFVCDGWIRKGEGSGHFDFAPNRSFASELNKRGIEGQPSDEQLMRLAFGNTSLAFIDEMKSMGYSFDVEQLIRVVNHGVTAQYLHELQAVGIKPASVDKLVRLRDHGVTADYAKEMASLGNKGLGEDELVRLRDHGVSADYAKEMTSLGYKGLDAEDLVRLRDHGVNAEYVKEIRATGLGNLDPDQLRRMVDHGVSAEFAQQVKADYPNITADQLVRMRDHGVSASYLQTNIKGRSVEEVIRMHDRGGNMD